MCPRQVTRPIADVASRDRPIAGAHTIRSSCALGDSLRMVHARAVSEFGSLITAAYGLKLLEYLTATDADELGNRLGGNVRMLPDNPS